MRRVESPAVTNLESTANAADRDALPTNSPALVLIHTDDPDHQASVDALAVEVATAFDLRSGVTWIEVPDGLAFVDSLLSRLERDVHGVRIAIAPPDAPVDELVARAVRAEDLSTLRAQRELQQLANHPVKYAAHFQPVVNLADDEIIGFEALIRASADDMPISAESLIASAEYGGWLARLDHMARRVALEAVGDWLDGRLLFLNIMAPHGAFDLQAAEATVRLARSHGIDSSQLVFEAAERNRYPNLELAAQQMEHLRRLGARIAVDDVADGYASLLLVSHFRPEVVKLTGGLVERADDPTTRSIVSAVVEFAHANGSKVVAEGVETEEQTVLLRTLTVDWAQGHFFGAPEPRS